MLVPLIKEKAAMLVPRPNPPGIELYYYANASFCFRWKTCLLITWVKTNNTGNCARECLRLSCILTHGDWILYSGNRRNGKLKTELDLLARVFPQVIPQSFRYSKRPMCMIHFLRFCVLTALWFAILQVHVFTSFVFVSRRCLGLFQTSCYCRAELKWIWLGSGTTMARQRFQTSNLIQSRQIQKTKQTIHPA